MYYLMGILGLTALVVPFVFNYSEQSTALWTSLLVGLVLIGASVKEGFAGDKERWEYWVAGIVGLGAIIAPFALGFSTVAAAMWPLVIVGVLALVAAGVRLYSGGPGRSRFNY